MKNYLTCYPVIRNGFESIEELGEEINRSRSYCKQRLNGSKQFTQRELRKIANYLGIDPKEIHV